MKSGEWSSKMYCDSKKLERQWFLWILSSASPSLDVYRNHGLLWTKVIGKVESTKLDDPNYPKRRHCIALAEPIYFYTTNGEPSVDLQWVESELSLISDSQIHALRYPLKQLVDVIPRLLDEGFIKEQPAEVHWHAILRDIYNICAGVASKFNLQNNDECQELASQAFAQVLDKLSSGRLVYTPGRAPVFNLLTTTIYRIMYSIMNKRTYRRKKLRKLLDDAEVGALASVGMRSFRAMSVA